MSKPRFVPIYDEDLLKEHGVFLSPTTLRMWRSQKKYPQLFTKVGGRVYIDLCEYEKLVLQGKGNNS